MFCLNHSRQSSFGILADITVVVTLEVTVSINITHRAAFYQTQRRSVSATQTCLFNKVHLNQFTGIRILHAICQRFDFILIVSKCQVRAPTEIFPFIVIAQRHLNTLVLYTTSLNSYVFETGACRKWCVERLVLSIRGIVGNIKVQRIVEETHIQTSFERVGLFRFQVRVRIVGHHLVGMILGIVFITHFSHIRIIRVTHRGVRYTRL